MAGVPSNGAGGRLRFQVNAHGAGPLMRDVTLEKMPTVFSAGNAELRRQREERTPPRLSAYFHARIRQWPHPQKQMECFPVGVFFDLGSAFRSGDAFELLNTATMLLWDELPDRDFLLGVELLLELAAAGTTEMP